MKKPFDGVLVRARKLAAILAPDSGAAPAEVETARKALDELYATYGINPDDLAGEPRSEKTIIAKSRYKDQVPKLDKTLALFCRVCLAYVVGEMRPTRLRKTEIEMPSKGLKIPMRQVYQVSAEVTDREYWEWKDCFDHYAPDFIEHMDKLREEARQAKFNLSHGWAVFCDDNEILPPIPKPTGKARAQTLNSALRMLCMPGAKQVSPWQRGNKLPESAA